MTTMGRYRYWGDQKPDTSRPLLTLTRPREAVDATARGGADSNQPATGTLRIYGPIDSWGGWWGVSAKEVAHALDLLEGAERIVVRVNSPGGESSEGRAIVSLLRAHAAEIVTVVDGAAYSAASYIAACGTETVMSPGSTLMIHDTSSFLYGNAEAFRKAADTLDILSDSGAELYAEIAGGTVEEWRDRQRQETWYSAASAVESGLMQRVGNVPDVGLAETAGGDVPEPVEPSDIEERAQATYDLSLFLRPQEGHPKPPSASAVGSHHTEGGSAMSLSDQAVTTLRTKLGIAGDADEATILAALDEALDERADESTATTTPTTPTTPAGPAVPAGHAVISQAELATLRANSEAGAAVAKTLHERDRAAFLETNAAKIPTALRETWAAQYDLDPAKAVEAIASMVDIVPTEFQGHAVDKNADGKRADDVAAVRDSETYKNWSL